MTHQPIVLGIIPARGGSKGVPRKNLHPLAGRPLIAHSIQTAKRARSLNRFVVSTDDEEIASVARSWGSEVPFMRPIELAQDDTPDLPLFQHALEWLWKHEQYRPDIIVHLRPTQPLRHPKETDEVVRLLIESGADSVKSVCHVTEHPHKMWRVEDGRLIPYLKTEFRMRVGPDYPRQGLEDLYVSTGVVDAVRTEVVESGSTTGNVMIPYFSNPATSMDLDSPHDFLVAEAIINMFDSVGE